MLKYMYMIAVYNIVMSVLGEDSLTHQFEKQPAMLWAVMQREGHIARSYGRPQAPNQQETEGLGQAAYKKLKAINKKMGLETDPFPVEPRLEPSPGGNLDYSFAKDLLRSCLDPCPTETVK